MENASPYIPHYLIAGCALLVLIILAAIYGPARLAKVPFAFTFKVGRWFRQHFLLLMALAFSFSFPLFRVALEYYLVGIEQLVNGLIPAAVRGAENVAIVNAQWVSMAVACSKLLLAIWFFCVANVLPWVALRITPVLVKWVKGEYEADPKDPNVFHPASFKDSFLAIPAVDRLNYYARIWQGQKALFAVCLLAACLIQ